MKSSFFIGAAAFALTPNFALAQQALEIAAKGSDIIVTAAAPDLAARPAGQTVSGASRALFDAQPAKSIAEVLSLLPGVTTQQGNGPRDVSVSVRGSNIRQTFGVRNVQVFEDGFPVTQPDGLARTDLTDPHAYAAIDVAKGPSSALYGNYATGGAIMFRTRSGGELKGGELGIDGGEDGYVNYFGALGGANEVYDAALFVSHVRGDGHISHSDYESTTLNGVASFSPTPNDRFTFKAINNDLQSNLSIRLSLDQFLANPYQSNCDAAVNANCASVRVFTNGANGVQQTLTAAQTSLRREDRRTILGGRWEHDFDPDTTGRLQAVWDYRDIEQPTSNTAAIGTFPSINVMADITRKMNLFGAPASVQLGAWRNYEENNSYTYNVMPQGLIGSLTRSILGNHANQGLRARLEVYPTEQWTIVAGAAVEESELEAEQSSWTYPLNASASVARIQFDRKFRNFAPEFGVVYAPNEKLKWHARVAAGYGTPQIGNLFVTPQGVVGANTQLNAQKNVGLDIGVDYSPTAALTISAAAFIENFEDELVTQSAGANLLSYTFNAPKSEHKGFELAADWKPLPDSLNGLGMRIAYFYDEQTYDEYVERLSAGNFSSAFNRAGNDIPGVVPNSLNVRASYDRESGALVGLGGFIEYVSRDSYYLDNANLLKAPDYQLVNLSLYYDPESGPLSNSRFYVSAQNLTDEVYVGSAGNISNTLSSTTGAQNGVASLRATTGSIFAGAPRTITAGVRLKF